MRLPVGLEEPINATTPKGVGLPPGHPTLPSLLKKSGYGTTLVGKWHLGFLPDYSPLQERLRSILRYLRRRCGLFQSRQQIVGPLFEQEVPVDRAGYMTNLLGDRAVQTIEGYARSKDPFRSASSSDPPNGQCGAG